MCYCELQTQKLDFAVQMLIYHYYFRFLFYSSSCTRSTHNIGFVLIFFLIQTTQHYAHSLCILSCNFAFNARTHLHCVYTVANGMIFWQWCVCCNCAMAFVCECVLQNQHPCKLSFNHTIQHHPKFKSTNSLIHYTKHKLVHLFIQLF